MREGQITLIIVLLLIITIGIVFNYYLQIQTDHMEIQRMNVDNLIKIFGN